MQFNTATDSIRAKPSFGGLAAQIDHAAGCSIMQIDGYLVSDPIAAYRKNQ
jgi:hypothetical protein